jgi:peptide/nickel transport system ATP-binding protein
VPALTTDTSLGTVPDSKTLEIADLRVEIKLRNSTVRPVDGVSLRLGGGETLGLVGESGCGKTMVGLSVLGLLPTGGRIIGGSIRLGDRELAGADESVLRSVRGNEVSMIFQDPLTSLNPTMTIGRQVAEGLRTHQNLSYRDALARTKEVLELVGLPNPAERLDSYPHQLSGGMRQRVMIAIALACGPHVLIADEPTTALDVTIQAQILDELARLRETLLMSLLLVTHDLGVVATRADRVAVMYAGQIVETADTSELFSRPIHPYTQALLNSAPRLSDAHETRISSIAGLPPDLSRPQVGCRFAPRCRYSQPDCLAAAPLLTGPAGGHQVACWHPLTGQPRPAPAPRRRPLEPHTASPTLLELKDVHRIYKISAGAVLQRSVGTVQAVSGVSLAVAPGQTLGLVGESGCGKSTLARLMAGLEQPTRGQVLWQGQDISRMSSREQRASRSQVQIMFQDPYSSLDPRMRVTSLISEPLTIQKVGTRAERRRRVSKLLEEVGLPASAAGRYPHEFSGGQRQRIGLARALALRPKLIVADEPVSALDVSIQAQILNLIRDLQERHAMSFVVISHDLAVVSYLADQVAVMYLGKLVEMGRPHELCDQPRHPYTAALLAARPDPTTLDGRPSGERLTGEVASATAPPSGCRFRTRCTRAKEICAEREPDLVEIGPTRRVACHFPL